MSFRVAYRDNRGFILYPKVRLAGPRPTVAAFAAYARRNAPVGACRAELHETIAHTVNEGGVWVQRHDEDCYDSAYSIALDESKPAQ